MVAQRTRLANIGSRVEIATLMAVNTTVSMKAKANPAQPATFPPGTPAAWLSGCRFLGSRRPICTKRWTRNRPQDEKHRRDGDQNAQEFAEDELLASDRFREKRQRRAAFDLVGNRHAGHPQGQKIDTAMTNVRPVSLTILTSSPNV